MSTTIFALFTTGYAPDSENVTILASRVYPVAVRRGFAGIEPNLTAVYVVAHNVALRCVRQGLSECVSFLELAITEILSFPVRQSYPTIRCSHILLLVNPIAEL